jgi:hypothetical protein
LQVEVIFEPPLILFPLAPELTEIGMKKLCAPLRELLLTLRYKNQYSNANAFNWILNSIQYLRVVGEMIRKL